MANPKIFGIGFQKPGTTSLMRALRLFGYKVIGQKRWDDPEIFKNVPQAAFAMLDDFDAFQDHPWPNIYKELDRHCPDSKFILTLRPSDEWIASVVRHFGRTSTPMREWVYGVGSPMGNETAYIERYERHNRDVLDYFKERPGDLLVMRITEGDGWEKLCPFLGKGLRDIPFPRVNEADVREQRNRSVYKVRARLHSMLSRVGLAHLMRRPG